MRAKRVDQNQKEIVTALRDAGCAVFVTSMVGNGFPDLCVSCDRITYLIEIKDGKKPPSQQKLTSKEQTFHDNWKDDVYIITSLDDVTDFLIEIRGYTRQS